MLGVVVLKSSQGQASSCPLMFGTNRLCVCTTQCMFPHFLCVCHTLLPYSLTHCSAFYHSILHIFRPSHFMLLHSILFAKTATYCHYFSQLTANELSLKKKKKRCYCNLGIISHTNLYQRDGQKLFLLNSCVSKSADATKCIINNLANFKIFCITKEAFGVIKTSIKTKSLAKNTQRYICFIDILS